MSNPWFRHYRGMMRDEKLVGVAVRCKQPIHLVLWVYGAILESASEINDSGKFEIDCAEASHFLREDEANLLLILDGLASAGRIADGHVAMWNERQYLSDKSVARQAAYRERKKANKDNNINQQKESDVTLPSPQRHVTAQDTDTDTERLRKKEPKKVLSKEKRGSRLPDNFEPDVSCHAVAEEMLFTTRQRQIEFEKFKDYWRGKPGVAGTKLDWHGTFRNWLRNSKTQGYKNGTNQTNHKPNSIAGSLQLANAAVDAILEREAKREAGISESYNQHDFISLPRLQQGNT
jgi:hypothetical protein